MEDNEYIKADIRNINIIQSNMNKKDYDIGICKSYNAFYPFSGITMNNLYIKEVHIGHIDNYSHGVFDLEFDIDDKVKQYFICYCLIVDDSYHYMNEEELKMLNEECPYISNKIKFGVCFDKSILKDNLDLSDGMSLFFLQYKSILYKNIRYNEYNNFYCITSYNKELKEFLSIYDKDNDLKCKAKISLDYNVMVIDPINKLYYENYRVFKEMVNIRRKYATIKIQRWLREIWLNPNSKHNFLYKKVMEEYYKLKKNN